MKKRIVAVLLGITMAMSVPTSAFAGETQVTEESDTTGGWSANQGSIKPSAKENLEAKQAFDKAIENLTGCDYELVAVLGSQVVAGTNYSYLCRTRIVYPGEKWKYEIVNVYEDLEGNASLYSVKELLDSKWDYNQGKTSLGKNKSVKTVYDNALDKIVGASYEPVAYLGSRKSKGKDYAILCRVTVAVPDAGSQFALITLHRGKKGKVTFETNDVDLSAEADTPEE